MSPTIETHIDQVLRAVRNGSVVSSPAYEGLLAIATENAVRPRVFPIGIAAYGLSDSFDAADGRFERFIRPHLPEFSRDDLVAVVEAIDGNGQTYNRRRADRDHHEIWEALRRVDPGFDIDRYPHFRDSAVIRE